MKALIFGITGQDGSYLAELLLEKGYHVIGVSRRASTVNTERLRDVLHHKKFQMVEGDVTDFISVSQIINDTQPAEIYNLAAQSHVQTSFNEPIHTWKVCAEGPLNILESVRRHAMSARVYQASTSEMFGKTVDTDGFQRETTPFMPQSPYAIAKLAAHHKVRLYREAYGLYAVGGILFNHESERRGVNFLSRKVTKYVAELSTFDGRDFPKLKLGNLNASRDWGYAPDYVRAMWLMLQTQTPSDYVIATGVSRTVRDFVRVAFHSIGVDNWEDYVVIDKEFYRPAEVKFLHGDASRARQELGWQIEVPFEQMVQRMVKHDIEQCTTYNMSHTL